MTVYLVGAGPGDPGLLTLRAKELLENAEVVVYDYLASGEVLQYANENARRIFVGKKGFSNHVTQDQINQCLIDLAREGYQTIVRLKGGDPFVFGRGGEEALALRGEGIDFEVVPGITAGVAAPAYAGIPITHRTCASSVTLITGHETPDKKAATINWEYLAKGTDTLCFYMGVRDLPLIVSRLIAGGRPASTPVALVRWGTTAKQEVLSATLDTVVEEVERTGFSAPAIIVVGEVVSLREELTWFEKRPLLGKRIVVTRSREQASALSSKLNALGAEVFEYPTIAIAPLSLSNEARSIISSLKEGTAQNSAAYDWVVFTSTNGVEYFFKWLEEMGLDSRIFAGAQIAAIGPATANALKKRGLVADLVPKRFVAEAVVEEFERSTNLSNKRILIPRASIARDTLPESLTRAGAFVQVLPVYDTVIPDRADQDEHLLELLREKQIDAVTFTSSSTARNFSSILSGKLGESNDLLAKVTCASIGPITSSTMRDCGIPVSVEAQTYTIPGLVDALLEALAAI